MGGVAPFLFTVVEDILNAKKKNPNGAYIETEIRVMVETASDARGLHDESSAILLAKPATTKVFGYDSAD